MTNSKFYWCNGLNDSNKKRCLQPARRGSNSADSKTMKRCILKDKSNRIIKVIEIKRSELHKKKHCDAVHVCIQSSLHLSLFISKYFECTNSSQTFCYLPCFVFRVLKFLSHYIFYPLFVQRITNV